MQGFLSSSFFIDAVSASNLRNIFGLREFLIEEISILHIEPYLYLVQLISLLSLSITVNTLIFQAVIIKLCLTNIRYS